MAKLTDKQKIEYYKKQELAEKTIVKNIKEQNQTVYGQRALNARFPPYLDRSTEDYDVYARKPYLAARMVEHKLDEALQGDFFVVKPAKHKGTFKVKSRVTLRGVVDYTEPRQKVPSENIKGVRYASLGFIKRNLRQNLRNPTKLFRSDKDKESLQRIRLYEKQKHKVKPKHDYSTKFSAW